VPQNRFLGGSSISRAPGHGAGGDAPGSPKRPKSAEGPAPPKHSTGAEGPASPKRSTGAVGPASPKRSKSAKAGRFLEGLLHTHDTPRRTAAAYAVGVFFGFSPFLGLHTVLGLAAAFALNLNRVAVVLGIYSNLPWILPPYYTLATMAGAVLLQTDVPPRLLSELSEAVAAGSWSEFRGHARSLAPLAWAYTLGSMLGAIGLALVAYRASLAMILAHRSRLSQHLRQSSDE
jgi:uncharacterized protein (DUF2062 family)